MYSYFELVSLTLSYCQLPIRANLLLFSFLVRIHFVLVSYYRDDNFIKKVGEKLRAIREEKGFSQENLSLEAGFPPSQAGRVERGTINTSISHIAAFARVLGVHPREILDVDFPIKHKRKS